MLPLFRKKNTENQALRNILSSIMFVDELCERKRSCDFYRDPVLSLSGIRSVGYDVHVIL